MAHSFPAVSSQVSEKKDQSFDVSVAIFKNAKKSMNFYLFRKFSSSKVQTFRKNKKTSLRVESFSRSSVCAKKQLIIVPVNRDI